MGRSSIPRGRKAVLAVSVVIPTWNRRHLLPSVLSSILADARRSGSPPAEVIVVDDGSTDGTAEWLERGEFAGGVCSIPLVARGGPARARNIGARAAKGRVLVFLADDLRIAPGLLAVHAAAHSCARAAARGGRARDRMAIGEIRWDPELRVTPFMRFLEEEGIHFDFAAIRREAAGGEIPFWRAYASNLSLPREALLALGGFDESFPDAAYEDLEFAYRFARDGGKLAFEPGALAWHMGPSTILSYLAWRRRTNRWALAACEKAPPLASRVLRPARSSGAPWRRLYANPAVAGVLAAAASFLDSSLSMPLPRALYRGLLSHSQPRSRSIESGPGVSIRPGWRAGASLIPARLLHERLAAVAPIVRGDVLDVGCGESPYAGLLDPASIRLHAGVDIRPVRRSPIPMAVARADGLPFRAGSFDTVLAIEVLEHCPDPAAALREATRCLRSGGTLVATVPFFYPPHDLPHDYFRLTAEGLAHLVRGAGLRVRSIDPIGGVGSVLADFAIKMASEAAFGLGMAVARALRLGPRGAEVWGRALGAFLARTSGLAGAAFLAARAVTIAWIARRPTGRLRSRLDRFLADRSSRVSKGYLAIAEKPGGEGSP